MNETASSYQRESYRSFPEAKWNLIDVLTVLIAVILSGVGCAVVIRLILGNTSTGFKVFAYAMAPVTGLLPVLWIQGKYGQSIYALGLRKGRVGPFFGVFIGIAAAVICVFALWPTLSGDSLGLVRRVLSHPLHYYLFILLTINGFGSLVLSPISEEILFRGFAYGYLRKRLGILGGLAIQASLFSLIHFGTPGDGGFLVPAAHRFILGFVLGLLYEKTGSLLPSIVCHSGSNYLAILSLFVR